MPPAAVPPVAPATTTVLPRRTLVLPTANSSRLRPASLLRTTLLRSRLSRRPGRTLLLPALLLMGFTWMLCCCPQEWGQAGAMPSLLQLRLDSNRL